jgi:hypothetical protein
MGGGNKVDIVGPLFYQLIANLPHPLNGHWLTLPLEADLTVLTEHALEGTAGKENGSRPLCAGNRRLLPMVEGGSCQNGLFRHPAKALSF